MAVEPPQTPISTLVDELSKELGTPGEGEVKVPAFRPRHGMVLAEAGKAYLRRMRQHIRKAHDAGAPSRAVERAFAAALDKVVKKLFSDALESVSAKRKTDPQVALLAVGGYGRGELAPFSDVDILFLYSGRSAGSAKKISEGVLYGLWDLGLDVGYSVRTIGDCVKFAEEDVTVRTAMLDARLLAGDKGLWKEFEEQVSNNALTKKPDKYLEERIYALQQRHEKYGGETVYLLEPNVKEGLGGLRDFQTILWIAKVKFHVDDVSGLHQLGFLNRSELEQFNRYFDFLLRVRHELHFQADQKNDRLAFDLQPKVAPAMGFSRGAGSARSAEWFMRRYYLVTRAGAQLTGMILERMSQYGTSLPKRIASVWRRPKDVGDGFYLLGGKLTVQDPEIFASEPWKMMLIFERAQELDVDLSTSAQEALYLHRQKASKAFLEDERVHASFRRIIQGKTRIFRTLWLMHELRLLTKYMPEFRTITCHVQHDAYHVHTTDIHTLFAVRELRSIMKGELEKELPLLTQIGQQIERPHVLYLGLLFHDVGKNMGGNHSVKGAERSREICARMGLDATDIEDVAWLVSDHLLLSHIALKRDLNDPRQISEFASAVGNLDRLEMLHLLTTADMRAVGPEVWTPWKGGLCDDAFRVTKYALEHGRIAVEDLQKLANERTDAVIEELAGEFPDTLLREELMLFPSRYFLVHSAKQIARHQRMVLAHRTEYGEGGTKSFSDIPVRIQHHRIEGTPYYEIVLYSLDVPRFFSMAAGAFAACGLSILSADITTLSDGTLLDVFHVVDPFGRLAEGEAGWKRLEKTLCDVLQGKVPVGKLVGQIREPVNLARFAKSYPTRITFDNESSAQYTIVDVTTGDRMGLLYKVTGALAEAGVTISLAKVSTKKERADDTFYLTDIFGQKIVATEKLDRIEQLLREAIGGTALSTSSLTGARRAG
ncbi:MAG: [protein-PII] uridylyltransferase [Chrysiogenetes bacterium]|nr:[protein-PII] uridylyltransferase [Chrysiogenetes bacterium]